MEKISGFPSDRVLGKHPTEIFPFLKKRGVLEKLEKTLKGESSVSYDFTYSVPEEGKSGWATDTSAPLYNAKNEIIGVIGMVSDITDRKTAEEMLQKNQYYLEKAQEIGSIGTWELDLSADILVWTEQNYKNFGVPVGTPLTYEKFLECIYPEDREYVNTEWTAAVQGKPYDIEHRLLVDGKIRWVREKADLVYNKDGKPVKAIGFTQDITEGKLVKESLMESEERFRKMFKYHNAIMLLIDPDSGAIIDANLAAEEFYGYNHDKICSLMIQDINQLSNEEVARERQKALKHKLNYFIFRHKLADNTIHTVEVHSTPLEINNRNILFSIIHDITARTQAKDKIKRQLAEKEVLLKEVHHRIKNNIASIESLLTIQMDSTKNPEAVSALKDALNRIKGMRILYEKLLLGKDYQEVSIREYSESLIDAIIAVFPGSRKLTITKQIEDFNINTKLVIPLGIILNELLTNVFKHAFKGQDNGLISVVIGRNKDTVILTLKDNGTNAGFDSDKTKGFGLHIIRMLTEQLKGTLSVEQQNGTMVVLSFSL